MTLKLKKIEKEDLNQIMQWRMMPEISSYMYTDPILTEESQLKWYQEISDSNEVKYWIIEFEGKKIGVINLYNIDNLNKRCFWAYYIGDNSFRGKGIGRNLECNIYDYVFNNLNFHKLCCEVLEENDKVVKIHQKFGSKIEGNFREHIFKKNKFLNTIRMGILKEEWKNIRSNYEYEKIEID